MLARVSDQVVAQAHCYAAIGTLMSPHSKTHWCNGTLLTTVRGTFLKVKAAQVDSGFETGLVWSGLVWSGQV